MRCMPRRLLARTYPLLPVLLERMFSSSSHLSQLLCKCDRCDWVCRIHHPIVRCNGLPHNYILKENFRPTKWGVAWKITRTKCDSTGQVTTTPVKLLPVRHPVLDPKHRYKSIKQHKAHGRKRIQANAIQPFQTNLLLILSRGHKTIENTGFQM
jgi:hypothetical protein